MTLGRWFPYDAWCLSNLRAPGVLPGLSPNPAIIIIVIIIFIIIIIIVIIISSSIIITVIIIVLIVMTAGVNGLSSDSLPVASVTLLTAVITIKIVISHLQCSWHA